MRRIPIHIKLAAALMVPLVALVVVAVVEVMQATAEADKIREEVDVVRSATGPNGLFNALEDERNRAGLYLIGQDLFELPCPDNASCRREVDRSLARFQEDIRSRGGEVEEAYAGSFEMLEGLDELRATVDANPGPYDVVNNQVAAQQVFAEYSAVIDALLAANANVTVAVDDPELRRGADLAYMATRNTDLIAHIIERTLSAMVSEGGLDTHEEIATIGGLFGLVEKNREDINDMSTGDYAEAGRKLRIDSESTGFRALIPQIIETRQIDMVALLDTVSVDRTFSYYGFKTSVAELVEDKASDLEAEAEQRARMFQALAAVAVLIAAMATWLVSRSITRPLRALTRQATEMANHRLPEAVLDILDTPLGDDVVVPGVEPISVHTRDEVADVADALNTVQDSALDLAVEQAVLRRNIADSFVNLGRRNQNLLGRQLDFITELEHNETDPDTLANLFRLDHLATRMRRNAESLLVLAGIDPPRKWAAPVRITDAIRAALGEVEDYQRVTVRAVEPATVLGSAAADLAHLLAELIENALIFSPPDQTVEIRGRAHPASYPANPAGGRPMGSYTLAVIDSGLGMPPDEIERANRRLAGAESFTIAPSKYLGHYVAGNLAARHNIAVTLHNSAGHGITATINLPPELLTAEPAPAPQVQRPQDAASAYPVLSPPFGTPAAAAPAAPAASLSAPPDQTASGLVKRARRAPEPTNRPQVTPDDDLLDTLARYTSQMPSLGNVPSAPFVSPGEERIPPPRPGGPLSPATGTPSLSHLPPFPVTPPSGYQIPPIPPSPPDPSIPQPPMPAGAPPPSLAAPPPPPLPARVPAMPQHTPAGGIPTSGGLTRRVRGAQLPNTQTVSLRRGTGEEPELPRSLTPAGGVPLQRREGFANSHSAKDVFSFLSDFTAGVQRGLDEADPDEPD